MFQKREGCAMRKLFAAITVVAILVVGLSGCSAPDKPVVLATVDNIEITQEQVDTKKMESEFSQQDQDFSDTEVLDNIIEEQLLLIKAEALNIRMSDDEVKQSYKEMLQLMSSKQYVEGDEDKLDKNAIEGLRNMLIIQKTKIVLGSDIDAALEKLRQEVKIEYYN